MHEAVGQLTGQLRHDFLRVTALIKLGQRLCLALCTQLLAVATITLDDFSATAHTLAVLPGTDTLPDQLFGLGSRQLAMTTVLLDDFE